MTRPDTATHPPLLDRVRERHDLDRAWTSGRPEMLIATGRRRAGKSFLLARYLEGRRGFYYQATRTTSREQLEAVYEAALVALPQAGLAHGAGFRDWDAFFRFIAQQAGGRPFLLVLDELPYLLDAVRGFGTILQKHWDHTFPRTKVKLVLTGSYSELLTYTTFASVLFGGLTVAAVYRLRLTQPDRPRPYRCWGYPLTPALYLAICLAFLIYVIQGAPMATMIGTILILTGIPFYLMWRARRSS